MGRKPFQRLPPHHITLKPNLNLINGRAVSRCKKMSGTEAGGDSSLQNNELLHDGKPLQQFISYKFKRIRNTFGC